jgi:sulfonate transport system substrate-binding protein
MFHKLLAAIYAVSLLFPLYSQAEESPQVVRIAAVSYTIAGKTVFMNSALVTKEGGLEEALAKRGVKLEWVPAATASVGPIINEGFANGTIDFASYGDLPPIILNSARPITQLVAPWGRNGNSYLVVPASSKAASIEDLKGKRIALHRGRPWEIAFANLVESKGLTLKDFKIVNVNPQVGAAALASGSVDAFFSLSDAYNLEDKKVGRIIWSTKNAPPDWKLMGGLWGRNAFVEKYPELTQAIVNSYIKANHWISQEKNRDRYFREYATQVQSESVLRRDYEQDNVAWKDRWTPLYDQALVEHYRRASAYAKKSGLIRQEVDLNKLLNPKFTNQALKDLGLDNFWTSHIGLAQR